MNRFDYVRASSIDDAIRALQRPGAKVLAGGTNLVDLMKYDVAKPSCVVDINRLPLGRIEALDDGGLRLGALVPNADAAYHDLVLQRAPLVASAILAGASPQLRNAATTGGNLLQRTRCFYFYDPDVPCNKRDPGSGCPAIGGVNRMHAILGASGACVAVHPSDMCVALAALDARINVIGPTGGRVIPMREFHRLPGTQPEIDTTLAADEVIIVRRTPALDLWIALHVHQGARSPVVCVCPRLRRGDRAPRRRAHCRSPPRRGRRRAQAVARSRGRAVLDRQACDARGVRVCS